MRARRFALALLALAVMQAATGCTSMRVHLGSRIRLDKVPLSTMHVSQANAVGIAPGEKQPLIVTLTKPDGTSLVTEGAGKGKVLWSDLTVNVTDATVDKKGVLSLPADPRVSDGKSPHIVVTIPTHPDLAATLDVPIRYDRVFKVIYHGANGVNGTNGSDGTDGSTGTPGSNDPDNPRAGGNGGDGTDGRDGSDGGDGGDGPNVQVRVALQPGVPPLLQVGVSARGKEQFFLVDAYDGSLIVSSEGGYGGSGGHGGRGGKGGSGGSGSPDGSSGRDGTNGRDGGAGRPGKGGVITVTYDPAAKQFLQRIRLSNPGGPAPVFKEQPVPPLW